VRLHLQGMKLCRRLVNYLAGWCPSFESDCAALGLGTRIKQRCRTAGTSIIPPKCGLVERQWPAPFWETKTVKAIKSITVERSIPCPTTCLTKLKRKNRPRCLLFWITNCVVGFDYSFKSTYTSLKFLITVLSRA